MPELTKKQERHLRALAHSLDPVVQIGKSGFTPALRLQVEAQLLAHELIKVKLGTEAPLTPAEARSVVIAECQAHVPAVTGRTLVLFRQKKKNSKIDLPSA